MDEEQIKALTALRNHKCLTTEQIGVRLGVLRQLQKDGWLECLLDYGDHKIKYWRVLEHKQRIVRKLVESK